MDYARNMDPYGFYTPPVKEVFCRREKHWDNLPAGTFKETVSWTSRTKFRSCESAQSSTVISHLHLHWPWLSSLITHTCGAGRSGWLYRRYLPLPHMRHGQKERFLLFNTGGGGDMSNIYLYCATCFRQLREDITLVCLIFGMSSLRKKGNSLWFTVAIKKSQNISVSNSLWKRLIFWRLTPPQREDSHWREVGTEVLNFVIGWK